MMPENKTKPTGFSVDEFIRNSDPQKIEDSFELVKIMEKISGKPAKMWGTSIVGFGSYDYQYESGHSGTMCRIGFSPRKTAFSLYILNCESEKQSKLVQQLGKIKMGKACIYFKSLKDLNIEILEELIVESVAETAKKWDKK